MGDAMNKIKFQLEWCVDDHCTDFRGVAIFDSNMTKEEWETNDNLMEIIRESVKLEDVEIPYKKITPNENKWAWRKAEPDEIEYLLGHDDFYEDLLDYWMENWNV